MSLKFTETNTQAKALQKSRRIQVLNIAYFLLGTYFLIALLLYIFQRNLLYFPTAEYSHSFDQLSLKNEQENLNIIVLNGGKQNALIYFGGNAEAVVANADDFVRNFPDRTVYLVNYRGYGGSSGKPTQTGLFSDALTIFDTLSSTHKNMAVMGRSLGSGIAMHLAANRPANQVVLITPYDSILALAQKQYPMFPIRWLLKDKYDSLSLAQKVRVPVLVLAAGNDTLIPLTHSQNLVKVLDKNKTQMVIIEQAGHNDISEFDLFYISISRFLAEP